MNCQQGWFPRILRPMAAPSNAWPLVCPNCDGALVRAGALLRCERGHSFDVAREGYVNLLIARDQERGISGDTPAQLHARRRVFERGLFHPLLHVLLATTRGVLAGRQEPAAVVDIGCGEGFYLGSIANALHDQYPQTRFIGFDVSKAAVRLAARRYAVVSFAVANVRRRIYAATASADLLLNVFAPRNPAEFARIVAPGGTLLVVLPTPDHLGSLRETFDLLDVPADKESAVVTQLSSDFERVGTEIVEFDIELDASATTDIIAMGPNAHHGEAWTLPPGESLTANVSLSLLHFRRKAES